MESLLKCRDGATVKALYFSYLFSRKAELPTRQMQLQSNDRQLLSFVIERVLTAENRCATADSLGNFIVSAPCHNCCRQSNGFKTLKSKGFDTLENKAFQVSNLKCFGDIIRSPGQNEIVVWKADSRFFSSHALWACNSRAFCYQLGKKNDCFAFYNILSVFRSVLWVPEVFSKMTIKCLSKQPER